MPSNVKHDPPLKCDKCSFTSPYATTLGLHKRQAHNIVGSSKAAQGYRERRAAELKAKNVSKKVSPAKAKNVSKNVSPVKASLAKPLKSNLSNIPEHRRPHPCPQCDVIAKDKAALTRHLHSAHGAARAKVGQLPCPECGKSCNGRLGLSMHLKRSHGANAGTQLALNGHRANHRSELQPHVRQPNEVSHARRPSQPQSHPLAPHFLFLAGYTTANIDHYAARNEVSADALTRGLAEFLSGQTHR